MQKFPDIKARILLRILCSKPLGYEIVRTNGSHKILISPHHPRIIFSFHNSTSLSGPEVKRILINQIELTEAQAWEVVH